MLDSLSELCVYDLKYRNRLSKTSLKRWSFWFTSWHEKWVVRHVIIIINLAIFWCISMVMIYLNKIKKIFQIFEIAEFSKTLNLYSAWSLDIVTWIEPGQPAHPKISFWLDISKIDNVLFQNWNSSASNE